MNFEEGVDATLAIVKNILMEKNKKYGNSALDPIRIFSRAGVVEQLKVRLDDKLSRVARGVDIEDNEDVVLDLIGYFVILWIAVNRGTV